MKKDLTILINVLPKERNVLNRCKASLDNFKDCIIIKEGVPGHIGRARYNGLLDVKTKYVCFVDPDDTVQEKGLYACLTALEKDDSLCGVYANEMFIRKNGRITENAFNSIPWDKKNQMHEHCVHGLFVMRNEYVQKEKELLLQYPNMSERVLCVALTKYGDWLNVPIVGYNWYLYKQGAHNKVNPTYRAIVLWDIAKQLTGDKNGQIN